MWISKNNRINARRRRAVTGVLGAMGAMLAMTGIFGMAAYSVSKRLKELGIRMALGAPRREVLQAALGRALKITGDRFSSGIASRNSGQSRAGLHRDQATPCDTLVLGEVVLAMCPLGVLAAWIPAQRALSVDPLMLLREH